MARLPEIAFPDFAMRLAVSWTQRCLRVTLIDARIGTGLDGLGESSLWRWLIRDQQITDTPMFGEVPSQGSVGVGYE